MKPFSTSHTTKSISSFTGIKSIWTTHANLKLSFMLTLKTSDFRPAFKNRANFDCPQNNQIIPILTLKSSRIRSPSLKSRQFVPPTHKPSYWYTHTKEELSSASTQVTSKFLPRKQRNQLHPFSEAKSSSIPHTEIKWILTTITKTKPIFMLTLKNRNFRPAHKNSVNFDHAQNM